MGGSIVNSMPLANRLVPILKKSTHYSAVVCVCVCVCDKLTLAVRACTKC